MSDEQLEERIGFLTREIELHGSKERDARWSVSSLSHWKAAANALEAALRQAQRQRQERAERLCGQRQREVGTGHADQVFADLVERHAEARP